MLAGNSYSQSMRLSLDMKNVTIKDVLSQIEDQSDLYFLYDNNLIDVQKRVDLVVQNEPIEVILEKLFGEDQVVSVVRDRHIILTPAQKTIVQQQVQVTGRVTDSSGTSIPGVTVVVKGTTQGTVTDVEGQYSLSNVSGDAVLVFSFVGMRMQEIQVAGESTINVIMTEETVGIEEVVAVGYGTQRKADLTGAVGSIGSKELSRKTLLNASQALAGNIAGVLVNQNSGMAGDDGATINIRGLGTLNDNSPLIIIDGVIASSQDIPIKDSYGSTQNVSSNNPLNSINPKDIESITVLKDAASASIYGSRAANGVIIVTTKRGAKGEQPRLEYGYTYGITQVTSYPEMITNSTDYMTLANEAAVNSGKGKIFSDDMINAYEGYGDAVNTNWMDELFQSATIQEHSLSVSGGSKKSRYFMSLGAMNQDAVIKVGDYSRYNGRINIDSEITNKLRVGSSITFSRGKQLTPSDNVLFVTVLDAMRTVPLNPAYTSKGELAMADLTAFQPSGSAQIGNAFGRMDGNKITLIKQDFLFNAYFEYDIVKNLTLRGNVTANVNFFDRTGWQGNQTFVNWRYDELVASGLYQPSDNRLISPSNYASLSKLHSDSKRINPFVQIDYKNEFGGHKINLMVGASEEKYDWDLFQTSRRTFASNQTQVLNAGDASSSQNSEQTTQNALVSQFGRLNYNFKDKYFFQANIRRDGSSRFSDKNRYGVFPSFSAGWVLSSEEFFKNNLNFINYLKLRGSWGKLGNQYTASDFPSKALISYTGNYNFGGSTVSGSVRSTFGNDDLKWETTTSTDFGFNMNLLNSKLSLEGDYFKKTSDGILYNTPIPSTTGFTSTYQNLASVENKGWEFTANYDEQISKVKLSLGFNISHINNQLKYINPTLDDKSDKVINGNYALIRGEAIDAIYGLKWIGIFQNDDEVANSPTQFAGTAPGDLKFEDISGPDGNPDGKIDANDRQVLGHESPSWIYGFSINIGYKNFELSSNFQGIGDAQTYGYFEYFVPTFQGSNFGAFWKDRWTPEHPSTTLPRLWDTDGPNTQLTNSFFVQDRSYLRLKNLQLSYSLPKALLEKVGFSNLKVYVNGQNLWTLTNFKGFDPEKSNMLTRSGFPQLKMYNVGVNLTF